jgi:hypothetical protein
MSDAVIAYCVKCKEKREMDDPERVEMNAKGGGKRPAMKGTCPECGTGMFKILPKDA